MIPSATDASSPPLKNSDLPHAPRLAPVPGFQGYFVDDRGGVFRERDGALRRLRPSLHHEGYLSIDLGGGRRRTHWVHRLVLGAFRGPPPSRVHQVRHLNGDRTDNRLENLEWGTVAENAQDRIHHGTSRKGALMHNARYSSDVVREIRALAAQGATQTELSARFGGSQSTISRVIARQVYADVNE